MNILDLDLTDYQKEFVKSVFDNNPSPKLWVNIYQLLRFAIMIGLLIQFESLYFTIAICVYAILLIITSIPTAIVIAASVSFIRQSYLLPVHEREIAHRLVKALLLFERPYPYKQLRSLINDVQELTIATALIIQGWMVVGVILGIMLVIANLVLRAVYHINYEYVTNLREEDIPILEKFQE